MLENHTLCALCTIYFNFFVIPGSQDLDSCNLIELKFKKLFRVYSTNDTLDKIKMLFQDLPDRMILKI
jgi:hypothetical protein